MQRLNTLNCLYGALALSGLLSACGGGGGADNVASAASSLPGTQVPPVSSPAPRAGIHTGTRASTYTGAGNNACTGARSCAHTARASPCAQPCAGDEPFARARPGADTAAASSTTTPTGSAGTSARAPHPQRPSSTGAASAWPGAEFAPSMLPGTYGTHYTYPTAASVSYFQSRGMNLVRLPFLWERLQPTLQQPFDATELGRLKAFVTPVTASGMTVMIDPHNYARYRGQLIGSAAVPDAAFADFWARLAREFCGQRQGGLRPDERAEHDADRAMAHQRQRRAGGHPRDGAPPTWSASRANAWTGAHSWSPELVRHAQRHGDARGLSTRAATW